MRPTMNLDTSASSINMQADLKAAQIDDLIYSEFTKPKKVWSQSLTSKYVLTFAEGLLKTVRDRVHLYYSKRVGLASFEVHYIGTSMKDEETDKNPESKFFTVPPEETIGINMNFENIPLPIFSRIRRVEISQGGVMHCSCCAFENRGLFCEHQCSVATSIYKKKNEVFPGFTHHDVALRYITSYMHLAFRASTPLSLSETFTKIMKSDIDGPRLKVNIPSEEHFSIEQRSVDRKAAARLKNYSSIDLDNIKTFDGLLSQSYSPDEVEDNGDIDNFVHAAQEVRDTTGPTTNQKYSDSIFDTDFPSELAASMKTRDMLKQKIEDCCAAADQLGEEAKGELGRRLDDFQNWCASKSECENNDGTEKVVPMTNSRYNGTSKRVFNTHNMW